MNSRDGIAIRGILKLKHIRRPAKHPQDIQTKSIRSRNMIDPRPASLYKARSYLTNSGEL
jgi:hypothetical protein